MKINLTDTFIKTIKPEKNNKRYYDTQIIGFGVVITPNNVKSFIYRYKFEGKEKLTTIGKVGFLTTAQAREKALELKSSLIKGVDLKAEEAKSITFKELADIYLKKADIRSKTITDYNNYLKLYLLPKFGKKPINEIKKVDIENFHKSLSNIKVTANRCLQLISSLFNYAVKMEILDKNPAQYIKKFQELKKERYLSEKELDLLLDFLQKSNKLQAKLVRLIFFTGARRGEIFGATWNDFDLKNKTWHKKAFQVKQKKDSYIPLNDEAINILKGLKEKIGEFQIEDNIGIGEKYVFVNYRTKKPLNNISKFWRTLKKETKINDLRIHDLRHNFASMLINKGVSLEVIGKLLGHSNIATTQRYAHLVHDSLKNATNLLNDLTKK